VSSTSRRKYLIWVSILAGLTAATAVLLLSWAITLADAFDDLRLRYDGFEGRVSEIAAENEKLFALLERIHDPPCSEPFLTAMRTAQFQASHVRDIGYLNDDWLLCSSTGGVLPEPFKDEMETIPLPTGDRLLLNVPLVVTQGVIQGHIVFSGNFNIVFRRDFLNSALGYDAHSTVYVRDRENRYTLLHGDESNVPPETTAESVGIDRGRLTLSGCSAAVRNGLCGTFALPLLAPMSDPVTTGLTIIAAFSAGITAAGICFARLRKLNRFHRRFLRGFRSMRFECRYQPFVDAKDHRTLGCEVLVRWRDDDGSIVPPDAFLPIVRNKGLGDDLFRFVVERTFRDLGGLLKQTGLKVSFNVNPTEFRTDLLLSTLLPYRDSHPETEIVVEITEDELAKAHEIRSAASVLRGHGIRVSIDDFGTGYSSLSYLADLHLDELKIDRSFVMGLEADTIRAEIVTRMVQLAGALNTTIVAEGIETFDQAQRLTEVGVHELQGYFFSKPMEPEAFIQRVEGERAAQAA
jgi:sensor c-di-GMP phosphodiesterase-like protein